MTTPNGPEVAGQQKRIHRYQSKKQTIKCDKDLPGYWLPICYRIRSSAVAFPDFMISADEGPTKLKAGEHICVLYDSDPAEQIPALVPFIQDAFAHGQQFIYIADDQTVSQLAKRLEDLGVDVARESERGALKLWTRKEWRQPGELDSARKSLQVHQFVKDARAAGFNGVRFAVEMTWTLSPDINAETLAYWEATINTILVPSFPASMVCLYNRSRLPADVILAGLRTHPTAIIGAHAHHNCFYEAPLILAKNGKVNSQGNELANRHSTQGISHSEDARVEWIIGQLEQARAAEAHQLELVRGQASLLETERAEDRKKAEEARQRLAAIVESSDDAIVGKDLNGTITSWNRGAQRIFGYTAEEVLGRSILILIPSERQQEEPNILERIRRGERIEHYETIRRRKDGTLITISLTVSPIRDANGRIIGASKIARDISERIRRQEALHRVQRELAELNEKLEQRVDERTAELAEAVAELEAFSYSITHDLRAPLRSMQSFATLLQEDCGDQISLTGRDYIRRIVGSARRMDRLIQDVLTYSRIARSELHLEPLDLDELLQGIIESYPSFQTPAAAIQVKRPLHRVLANEGALTQCLGNLISNAIKFVAPGTMAQVSVWSELVGKGVRVYVQDKGIGIPPRHQERIFGIFQRLSKTYEGTGIGLSIVKKAAERMGGSVGVRSEQGKGSTFWLDLRAARRQPSDNLTRDRHDNSSCTLR